MKRIFVLVCAVAFLFAGAAFGEPIRFPNGLTVDVAPGWSYEGTDEEIILTAEDNSCVIFITVADADGLSGREIATAMSEEHGGSEPQQIYNDTYFYTFINEHGVECKVFAGVEDGRIKVVLIAGDHNDIEDMLASIEVR